MSDLTDAEREALTNCDCGHDIGGEHNSAGCYATVDYGTRTQRRCDCKETDARPSVNYAAVERILADRLRAADAERDVERFKYEHEHKAALIYAERAEKAEADLAAHEALRAKVAALRDKCLAEDVRVPSWFVAADLRALLDADMAGGA